MEITNTSDSVRLHYLKEWFAEVWNYWLDTLKYDNDLPSYADRDNAKTYLIASGILDVLPDLNDRLLICDAISYKCDCFCTRDYKTIIKHRGSLTKLPIKILTPNEWWKLIEPYARL